MASETNPPVFSLEVYSMRMLLARKADIRIAPPARPVLLNPAPLELLGWLQFFHGDATYKRLLRSEGEEPSSFGFAHPL